MLDPAHKNKFDPQDNVVFNHTVVIDGQVLGTWKHTLAKGTVAVEVSPSTPFSDAQNSAIARAAEHYGRFLGLSATLAVL